MADVAALHALIEPEVERLGYALVRVAMTGSGGAATLQVMAERPETRQLDLNDCVVISRALSDLLDAADPIETEYRLEVSSPGIDRPLTRAADYDDWAGHEARLNLAEAVAGRKRVQGVLRGTVADGGDRIVLIETEPGQPPFRVPLAAIRSAKLTLTDSLIRATAPISAEGADRIIEEK